LVCGSCGSIDIIRYRSTAIDKLVRLFSNRKRVICRRCGWTARMPWDHDDNYVPKMAQLRTVEVPEKTSDRIARFEDEFDINKFH
jgi:RNase P subunit RPR2